ncbi:MAG TPA: C25 family cysteine peptidase [Thermoanaerobaculia bacterium]|nr:C25 family cysteine peptidase [Thermoanaerobaculia bacterium]HUM30015.1 C25 family cysteine peptidase [Thermoanaerobaculia bacterium]HXK68296.1 C25 family cysteine peptidase [Thermoanaerobaculia bacterium]
MYRIVLYLACSASIYAASITVPVSHFLEQGTPAARTLPGAPAIPEIRGTVVLPPGSDLSSLSVSLLSPVIEAAVEAEFTTAGPILVPGHPERAIWKPKEAADPSNSPVWFRIDSTGYLGPLPIVSLRIYPYQASGNTVSRLVGGTLVFSCKSGKTMAGPLPPHAGIVLEHAVNGIEARRWFPARSEGSHLLILTTNRVFEGTRQLPTYILALRASGWVVTPVGVESFAGDREGQARAAAIREYIRARVVEGVTHVLLIGDPNPLTGDLPMRYAYPLPEDPSHAVPTDLYYADLSGNWDLDGDGYEGTYGLDTFAGGVDLYPEVIVGRIPVYRSQVEQLDGYLRRILYFRSHIQGTDRTFLLPDSIPFLPNEMGLGEPMTDGAELGEEFSRDVLDPVGTPYWKMYEKGGIAPSPYECDFPITEANVVAAWKMGASGVLYYGHGGQDIVVRTLWDHDDGDGRPEADQGEIAQHAFFASGNSWDINPTMPSFVFGVACNNGTPENENNLAASMLRTGAIGTFGATRWAAVIGWETDFVEHCTAPGIGFRTMKNLVLEGMDAGTALLMAKSDPAADRSHSYWWANLYDYNLYGDPTVTFYGGDLSQSFPEPGIYWSRVEPEVVPPCGGEIHLTLRGSSSNQTLSFGNPVSEARAFPPANISLQTVTETRDNQYHASINADLSSNLPGTILLPVTLGSTTIDLPIQIASASVSDPAGDFGGAPEMGSADIVQISLGEAGTEVLLDLDVASPLLPVSFFQGEDFYAAVWWLDTLGDGQIDMSVRYYMYQGTEWAILTTEPYNDSIIEVPFIRKTSGVTVRVPTIDFLSRGDSLCAQGSAYAITFNYGDNYEELGSWACLCLGDSPPPKADRMAGGRIVSD